MRIMSPLFTVAMVIVVSCAKRQQRDAERKRTSTREARSSGTSVSSLVGCYARRLRSNHTRVNKYFTRVKNCDYAERPNHQVRREQGFRPFLEFSPTAMTSKELSTLRLATAA
jgi:hypothetical protein